MGLSRKTKVYVPIWLCFENEFEEKYQVDKCIIVKHSKKKPSEENTAQSIRPPSCLLLPEEPKRGGDKPRLSKKTNIHVLVEFGLQLLCMCLKRGRLVATEESHLQLVDPFITVLTDCLYSKHIRVSTLIDRVIMSILEYVRIASPQWLVYNVKVKLCLNCECSMIGL